MKKLISALVIMFLCSMSYAESMKFITVLSSPVGTFNKLEAVDPSAAAKGATVNFCTKIGTQGLVKLKGTSSANLSTVTLSDGSTLGRTDGGKFSLSQIELHSGGSLIGGRLLGNTVNVSNAASGKATQLHGNTLTVAGAKTKTLDVKNGASKISVQHDAADMVWSNEYQDDDACKAGSACAKQYLLKQKNSQAEPSVYDHQPYTKEVKAAKVCGTRHFIALCGGSSIEEQPDYYIYADEITQTPNFKSQSCDLCKSGIPNSVFTGPISRTDTNYTNRYNVAACPDGYTDAQLCTNNCDPAVKECSFMCLKSAANISGCGDALLQQKCLCVCGTQPGENACFPVTEIPVGYDECSKNPLMVLQESDTIYEPLLGGTGTILGCRAVF